MAIFIQNISHKPKSNTIIYCSVNCVKICEGERKIKKRDGNNLEEKGIKRCWSRDGNGGRRNKMERERWRDGKMKAKGMEGNDLNGKRGREILKESDN